MALMHITVIPIGTGSASVGDYIADIEQFLTGKGVDHSLGDMGTVIYGSADELLQLASEIHNFPFNAGVQRVVTQLTIDDRRDIDRKIGEKREAVINRIPKK